jgi:isocitrate dehydrogenase
MAAPSKIKVSSPIAELDGDEMTRVLWAMIKKELLFPFLEMDLDYYDLHVKHRDDTDDRVTADAADAVARYGVGVKCATITPNAARVSEYGLKKEWKSPNATIRSLLDGTVFRAPILVDNIPPSVRGWTKPITIGRHAYGDVYKNAEIRVDGPGEAEIVFHPAGKAPVRKVIQRFEGPGVIQGIHNTDASILSFARACFTFGLDRKLDVWFATKDTISKTYDTRFKEIFEKEFADNWKARYDAAGLQFFYTLIDDAVARIVKSEGGMLWACKNYDGDVMSDMLASAYGSLAMMTSVLVSPRGCFMYEAAHGTVQRHYYRYLNGEKTSTNPMALIFAWSAALRKRGELDDLRPLAAFADLLEASALETIEGGVMTKDLVHLARPDDRNRAVNSEDFLAAIRSRLASKFGQLA